MPLNNPVNQVRAHTYAQRFTLTNDDSAERSRLESLTDAAALCAAVETVTQLRVDDARRLGHTWAEIGEALGVSRQAAQQKFGKD